METPPGALSFVDWKEDLPVKMGRASNWVKVQGLCFALGFSRKMAVRFSARKDLESFVHGHQEAFRVFGGLLFAIQDEISLMIADKLKLTLLGEDKARLVKRPTENLEAHNLYLQG